MVALHRLKNGAFEVRTGILLHDTTGWWAFLGIPQASSIPTAATSILSICISTLWPQSQQNMAPFGSYEIVPTCGTLKWFASFWFPSKSNQKGFPYHTFGNLNMQVQMRSDALTSGPRTILLASKGAENGEPPTPVALFN